MFSTKQTARKSTGGTVGPYTLAGHQAEDEDEDLGESDGDEEEDEDEADDANMAAEAERLYDLRYKLDQARLKLDSELDKGAARDKELVASYERRVEDLGREARSLTQARADMNKHVQSQAISSAGEGIEQAIREHGENVANQIAEQGAEILEYVQNHC